MVREVAIDKENLDYLNHHETFYICDMTDNLQYWMIIVEKESFAVCYENGGLPSYNTLSSLQFFKITHHNTVPIYLDTAKSVIIYTLDVNIVGKNNKHCCCGVMIRIQFKNFFAELEISETFFVYLNSLCLCYRSDEYGTYGTFKAVLRQNHGRTAEKYNSIIHHAVQATFLRERYAQQGPLQAWSDARTLQLMCTSIIIEAVRTCGNIFKSIGESELKRIWGPNVMNKKKMTKKTFT
ncbi:hypothetical protein RFI_34552 [Reticulomyxa filosa]|uniref:Uncharacterized protein n=1 Tax=Reticulomyxa filosa TaxID=46433 RepID=X6LND2_RETFI|nr:hypothetical protein RFI_34552 [Reticulomyxa filosa]|eukprot:ETO02861.1 hypothetical protein RFI_34552 [Reticulomyxa filosa]